MTDYSKLVDALRCKRDDCEGCDIAFLDNDEGWICQYAAKDDDAAAAIEALQAAEPTEKQVVDYCHKRCLVVLSADLFHELKASYGKLPKQGKWVREMNVYDEPFYHCSACGECFDSNRDDTYGIFNYCPNCGAKMTEVQE